MSKRIKPWMESVDSFLVYAVFSPVSSDPAGAVAAVAQLFADERNAQHAGHLLLYWSIRRQA